MNVTTGNPNSPNNKTAEPDPTNMMYLVGFGANGALGLPVNSYVLWLICSGKGNGIVSEFFSLNLALCEIFFCLGSLAFTLIRMFPVLYLVICFSVGLPFIGRPMFQCIICMERFQAVLYPVSYLKYKPLRYRLAGCAVLWTLVIGFAVFCLLVIPLNNMILFLVVFLPLYAVLLIIKLYCSIAIYKALKKPRPGEQAKEKDEANRMKRKAMNFIMIITASMFCQNSPVCIVGSLYGVLPPADFYMYWCVSILNSMVLSYVSPALYIYRVKRG